MASSKRQTKPKWVSNLVLVLKLSYNGNFSKLTRACPKDSLFLYQIDQLVYTMEVYLNFMDAYLDYNKISITLWMTSTPSSLQIDAYNVMR